MKFIEINVTKLFIQGNVSEKIVCEMAAISWSVCGGGGGGGGWGGWGVGGGVVVVVVVVVVVGGGGGIS